VRKSPASTLGFLAALVLPVCDHGPCVTAHGPSLVYARANAHDCRYDDALGVKSVSWSPSGQLLSIGSYDQKVRLLNHMTWKTLAEHDHTQTKVDGRSVDVYREHTFYDGATERTRYAVEDSTVVVPTETPDEAKPFPKLGVGMQAWSSDSALLFTRNDNAPTALWVWETVRSRFPARTQFVLGRIVVNSQRPTVSNREGSDERADQARPSTPAGRSLLTADC
jgi:hypothetical protein